MTNYVTKLNCLLKIVTIVKSGFTKVNYRINRPILLIKFRRLQKFSLKKFALFPHQKTHRRNSNK